MFNKDCERVRVIGNGSAHFIEHKFINPDLGKKARKATSLLLIDFYSNNSFYGNRFAYWRRIGRRIGRVKS